MTLSEKLDESIVVDEYKVHTSTMGIQTKKQRIKSFIFFLAVSIYSIYSKIILKSDSDVFTTQLILNISLICLAFNMFTMFVLKILGNSILALNYNKTYKLFVFLNKLSKVCVFGFGAVAFTIRFGTICANKYNTSIYQFLADLYLGNIEWIDILNSSDKEAIILISLIVSIITFVPTVIYFILSSLKYGVIVYTYFLSLILYAIPILNVVLVKKFLQTNRNKFKYYKFNEKDKRTIDVEVRELKGVTNKLSGFIKNIVLGLPYIVVTIGSYVAIYVVFNMYVKF